LVTTRDVEAEAVEFLWKGKHFEERSWNRKHLTFLGAGSGSIFHKTWGRNVEAKVRREKRKYFEERSWKRKQKIFYCFYIPGYDSPYIVCHSIML